MPDVNLDKMIEKILTKIKKEKKQQTPEEASSGTGTLVVPPTSATVIYLKALPLRSIEDVELFKREIKSGNILIVRVSPLAKKSIADVQHAVSELCEFTESIGGDIARLGEERVVITPPLVKIWRERDDTSEGESTVT